jgi:hypothetical protein
LVIIPKSDRLSGKTEIKTEKSWQIAENFLIFSFFLYIFKCLQRKFGIFKVLGEFWRGLEEPRSCKIYSSGNRGVKKGPGHRGSRDEEFPVPSLPNTHGCKFSFKDLSRTKIAHYSTLYTARTFCWGWVQIHSGF